MWTGKDLEESLVEETEMIGLASGRDSNRSGYCRLPCDVVSSLCLQTDAVLTLRKTSLGSVL